MGEFPELPKELLQKRLSANESDALLRRIRALEQSEIIAEETGNAPIIDLTTVLAAANEAGSSPTAITAALREYMLGNNITPKSKSVILEERLKEFYVNVIDNNVPGAEIRIPLHVNHYDGDIRYQVRTEAPKNKLPNKVIIVVGLSGMVNFIPLRLINGRSVDPQIFRIELRKPIGFIENLVCGGDTFFTLFSTYQGGEFLGSSVQGREEVENERYTAQEFIEQALHVRQDAKPLMRGMLNNLLPALESIYNSNTSLDGKFNL